MAAHSPRLAQRSQPAPVLVLLVLVAATVCAAAQQQPPPPGDVPATMLRVTTRLVTVDVVVTDKQGAPVTGLTREDFTVLENGRPQAIAAFSFEQPGLRAGASPPPLPPHTYTNRPEHSLPPGPLTILLLDAVNTPVQHQAYARQQLLRYLATQLQPNQRTAILVLGSRLLLLQDFTTDPRLLQAALGKYSGEQSRELAVEERLSERLPGQALEAYPSWMLSSLETLEGDEIAIAVSQRVNKTVAALQTIARAMAGYPGRKNLVWVSAAFPFRLMPGNVGAGRAESSHAFSVQRVANALTDAQVAVYPVDARGLVGYQMADASDPQRRGFNPLVGPGFGAELSRRDAALAASQETMYRVADDTGGLAFTNRNDIDRAVQRSIADGSTYYALAYYPEDRDWDGKFRKIEVRVNRKGVEVRHRRGYYAVDLAARPQKASTRTQEVLAALADPLPANVITFLARVPPPAPASPATVAVEFRVDAHTFTYEPDGDGRQRFALEFIVGAFSPAGERVLVTTKSATATLTPEQWARLRAQGLPFEMTVTLPPGPYQLRLLVRDQRTGLLGATDVSLLVPSP